MPAEDESATLRDFVYIDSDRVRSLLAQLDGGVVDQVVEQSKKAVGGQAGGRVFGLFDLHGSLTREKASEQTKTLQDALYFIFEEAADRERLFTSLEGMADPSMWRDGRLHQQLREGQLIRCRAPTRILDARLFQERTHRYVEMSEIQERLEESDEQEHNASPGTDEFIRDIGDLFSLLLADQISIRQFPCGPEERDLSIAGTLLARPGFLQEEREALFSKYGSAISEWTMAGQVARLPSAGEGPAALPQEPASDAGSGRRLYFEELAVFGMRTLEQGGFVEAPVFPSIHVTPLAVYREVLGTPLA